MHALILDVRYGFRTLRKNPGVTLMAVLSLALGIGGNSTMFSVIHTLLLQPPAYQNLDRLVVIWGSSVAHGQGRSGIAGADVLDCRKQSRSFEYLELTDGWASPATLRVSGSPERVRRQFVSPNLFQALGVKPLVGRNFSEEEVHTGPGVMMMSYEFWQRRFGADPGMVGGSVYFDGNPVTIVGVTPPKFGILGESADLWQPLDVGGSDEMTRKIPWLIGIGRLRPGVTLSQAQTELSGVARRLEQAYPDTNRDRGVLLDPLASVLTADMKEYLYPLFGAVGFVLLIACANVANLLLAQAAGRKKEIVVRAAMGAGRARLVRQLLTESVLLASLGGVAGLLVGFLGIKLFQVLASELSTRVHDIALNAPVTIFTLAVSIVTGILAGLAPAIQASRADLNESLKESARGSGRSQGRTRAVFVTAEVTLALLLLTGAGLMLSSLVRLSHVQPGFDPAKLLSMQIDLSGPRYMQVTEMRDIGIRSISERVEPFYERVLEQVRSLPGVESATLVAWLPLGRGAAGPRGRPFVVVGRPEPPRHELPFAMYNMVSSDYFRTMRIPLVRGRVLTEHDKQSAPWVIVINKTMAQRFWPNEDPIGQVITIRTIKEERPRQIVGVVGDVRQQWRGGEPQPEFYAPFEQQPPVYGDGYQNRVHRFVVARTALKPQAVMDAVRAEVLSLDHDQPVYDLRTMDEFLSNSTAPWRLYLRLLGTFAAISLFLAAIGIYGVMSHSIGARTHEIGIRLAIGAGRWDVVRLVFRQGMMLTAVGLAIGLMASFAVMRVIANFLYGVKPYDPLTLTGAVLLLAGVACAAILQPAVRASRVAPAVALRHE